MRMLLLAFTPQLGVILPVYAVGGCSLQGGQCVCEDADGNSWDLTELTAPSSTSASQVVATGPCSGTYCSGTFDYYVDICSTMTPVQACNFGMCCSASTPANMYRVDSLNQCPPSTQCQCDLLGISVPNLEVTSFDQDGDVGLTIKYEPNSYYASYAGWVSPVVNIICDNSASSTAYTVPSSTPSTNPSVVNAAGCTSKSEHLPPCVCCPLCC
jgi:hypothetical protein